MKFIACNVVEATSVFRANARGYLQQCHDDRCLVLMRSRSGRFTSHWFETTKLKNFRIVSEWTHAGMLLRRGAPLVNENSSKVLEHIKANYQ
jgi:hypothetical protein